MHKFKGYQHSRGTGVAPSSAAQVTTQIEAYRPSVIAPPPATYCPTGQQSPFMSSIPRGKAGI